MKTWTIALCALLAAGCESVDSEDIATSGIFARLDATAEGDGQTTVSAELKVGGSTSNTYLDLSEGDSLSATVGDASSALSRHEGPLGLVWYDADFEGDTEDLAISLAFERATAESAPSSAVTLPAPLALTAPTSGQSFSRSADLVTIEWSGSGESDELRVSITGDCLSFTVSDEDAPDTGRFEVSAGLLVPDEDTGETCLATVTLERYRAGTVDPAYGEGGTFIATQRRTTQFTSTP